MTDHLADILNQMHVGPFADDVLIDDPHTEIAERQFMHGLTSILNEANQIKRK